MSKVLVFQDGVSVSLTDASTATDCITVVSSYADIDTLRAEFTNDNLVGCTFDGELVENLLAVSSSATADVDGNVTVHFYNRYKTESEILSEQVTELQEAIAEIGA